MAVSKPCMGSFLPQPSGPSRSPGDDDCCVVNGREQPRPRCPSPSGCTARRRLRPPPWRAAGVEPREGPDAEEGDRHREEGRVVVGEEFPCKAEGLHPDGLAQHHHDDRADQAQQAADQGAPGRRALPEHGHQQNREVAARRDREGQADHEGDVLVLEDVAENDRDDADDDGRDLRDVDLLLLRHPAPGDDRGIEVVADGRGAGQGEARHHGEDRRERHSRDEAEEERAARLRTRDGSPPCWCRRAGP